MSNERKEYDTGAVRNADCEPYRYDLISPVGLESLASTYAEGVAKFGYCNWENGMPIPDLLNHAIAHIYKYLGGDRSENHLGHAAWNIIGAIHSEKLWPELNRDLMRGPNCSAPAAARGDERVSVEPAPSRPEAPDVAVDLESTLRRQVSDLEHLRARVLKKDL